MKEDIELCTYFKHHKMKLTLFLTAMRDYRDLLKKNGFEVHYKPLKIDQKTKNNYIDDLRVFIKKMKAVDPTIKIGVVGYQKPKSNKYVTKNWNKEVLPEIIDVADFYIF